MWDSPGWGGGVATVEPAVDDHVWGVLWELTDEHVRALDEYEGLSKGVYTRETFDVRSSGETVKAVIYLATDSRYKKPSARYISALIRGAKAFAVPDDYVEQLRALRA